MLTKPAPNRFHTPRSGRSGGPLIARTASGRRRLRQTWRQRYRPIWQSLRPTVLIALALAALLLGTLGFLSDGSRSSVTDAFYQALQLFAFEGSPNPPVPLELEIARLLAPLVVGYAAVTALLALLRQQLQVISFGTLHRHTVVAGLGDAGRRVALALHDSGRKVAVIERDAASPAVRSCRERGIPVLLGDATDPMLLRRIRITKADYLVASCGEDGVNVDIAEAAEKLTRDRRSGTLTAIVHLDDLQLWQMLRAEAVTLGTRHPGFRVEFFNVADSAARELLDRHPLTGGEGPPHLLLHGFDGLAPSLLTHAIRLWEGTRGPDDDRFAVTVIDAADRAQEFLERHPTLAARCDLRNPTNGSDPLATHHFSSAFICKTDQGHAVAAALAIAQRTSPEVPIVVVVPDADSGVARALRAAGGEDRRPTPFGTLTAALSPGALLGGATEMLARAKHEQYLQDERQKSSTPETNGSMRPWEALDESLKASNRRFADGIGTKLASIGWHVVPAGAAPIGGKHLEVPPELVEELAQQEHDRWMQDLIRDGWTLATDGHKDPVAKRHPLLIGWEELPEPERDKDREPVRSIPQMIANAGLDIVERRNPA